jgi:hypothetical protein
MANENNLKPIQTESEAREKGRQGGIASGKARRERKTLADTLRVVLEEKANDAGLTRREAIVAKVVKRLYDEGDIRDLKILADVLGESEQTINLKGVAPIVAKDAEDAAKIQGLLDSVAARKNGGK